MLKLLTATVCTAVLLCGSAYAQTEPRNAGKPTSIMKGGSKSGETNGSDNPQAPSGLSSQAIRTVPAAMGNKSMNPNAGAAGMENDMNEMRQRIDSQNAAAAVKKAGAGLHADTPKDALSESGSKEAQKINERKEQAAQAQAMKAASCTTKCNKSNPLDNAMNNALHNGGSKWGGGLGGAMQDAKENAMKKDNSPSENKMMEEAKAKAEAEKEAQAKAAEAKKEQAVKACIKQCMNEK